MSVKRKTEHAVGSRVDKAEQVLLAGLEFRELKIASTANTFRVGTIGTVEYICSIDKAILSWWGPAALGNVPQRESGIVIPVGDDDWAKIHIVVGTSRAIDNEGTGNTFGILKGEVGVIPGSSVFSCSPFVGQAAAGSDWALW